MRFDAIALVLHALFGVLLGAFFWFAALGGMSAWFRGHSNGWLESKKGLFVVILIGALCGAVAGVFRDRQIVRIDQDDAAGVRVGFRVILRVGLPLALGLYLIWSFLH